ncbi:uracil-DNA glycosylase family protein [Rhizobium sp. SSA_523]|uniref:uracil-DNA glycosylase n=1 Tax=Rhizobium sp. SSA_523 TaxID=2952477 RepID=UPI002090550A|nr:uracil-DNA glycosylase [Rhizobium sp. SSA_523]MCO5730879.1 uracil-DNA glycosylase [Rhizobium sp. SSA_523]WKC24305.1 uracil-DNA glycosylase [Rhizobium sp. SSA_523]
MTPASELSLPQLKALLQYYADSGVDWLLEETPVDRIAEFDAQKAARAADIRTRPAVKPEAAPASQPYAAEAYANDTRSNETYASEAGAAASAASERSRPGKERIQAAGRATTAAMPTVAVPDAEAVAAAKAAATAARTLGELKDAIEGFSGCNLKAGARSTVFASGSPTSGIMVIGPMPSADDDRDGMPFAGRLGQMLDRMLSAIGLSRETVLLTNVLPWRPPGNRQPSPAEIDICRPFIERQVALAEPTHLLLLGNFPARFFLDADSTIFSLRGAWHEVRLAGLTMQAMASLHPQDLITAPANKALAWQDLLLFRQGLPKL